ncbi:MAG: DAK2 domain-containing protein, partial [Hungatella hathewayi]
MQVVKSALDCLMGKELDLSVEGVKSAAGVSGGAAVTDDFDIRFGYCTEFIVNLEKPYDEKSEHDFKGYLESIGDSIVVVSDDDIVKVHVHTNDPGLAIQKALTYGSLSRMKIDNMREEHQEKLIKDSEKLAAHERGKEKDAGPRKPYGSSPYQWERA